MHRLLAERERVPTRETERSPRSAARRGSFSRSPSLLLLLPRSLVRSLASSFVRSFARLLVHSLARSLARAHPVPRRDLPLRPLPLTVPTPTVTSRHYQQLTTATWSALLRYYRYSHGARSSSSYLSAPSSSSASFSTPGRPGRLARDIERERCGESRVPRVPLLVQVRSRLDSPRLPSPPPHPATCLSLLLVCSFVCGGECARLAGSSRSLARPLARSPPPLSLELTTTPAHGF